MFTLYSAECLARYSAKYLHPDLEQSARCHAAGCAPLCFLNPTPIARTSLLRLFGPLPSYILYSVAPLLARCMLSAKMHLMMRVSTSRDLDRDCMGNLVWPIDMEAGL